MRRIAAALAFAATLLAAPVVSQEPAQLAPSAATKNTEAFSEALANPSRMFDRRRDVWRHPAETLAFFDVEPGMTVVDYIPATGWYTRVLVPYLGEEGRYIGVHPAGGQRKVDALYGAKHQAFASAVSGWTLPGASIEAQRSDRLTRDLSGKVDRVLIMRELHNLAAARLLDDELAAIRKALKPDGMLGIEQHRAPADAGRDYDNGSHGYMREAQVIAAVEKAGFRLVAKSEINANPKDTAVHPNDVWSLPPVWRGRDPAMQAVGESDRMTLLFALR